MRRPEVPGLEESEGPALVTVVPEPSEVFLNGPGPADFEVHSAKRIERRAEEIRDVFGIQAFQVMDRVIQNNQPIFLFVWVGSVVALIASVVLGIGQLDGAGRLLIIFAALAYLLGVQLPTVTINIPLNNEALLGSVVSDTRLCPPGDRRRLFHTCGAW